ncbi:glycosyltransferase [Leptolyngbya sp. FACHB-261]|uniref:glycosyltransferase family 2 protein n=1 Tax=Leptolyngbya sp. FACHB-261 TaxID=2692806 RepID=UPI00168A313F|nr:glycosyltransferase [Leptolyngbya sp. FACHB-261]
MSVIIPSYNRKHCIEPALSSVLQQTYPNYELIVVDDASSDGTADWIAQTYPEVRLLRLSQNEGAAGARNQGMSLASGELIAFLDSDDQWLPNYLEAQIKTLQAHPEAVLAFCDCLEVKGNRKRRYIAKPKPTYPDLIEHLLLDDNFIITMSVVMVRSEALKQSGALNQTLRIVHDREWYLRLLHSGSFAYTPQCLVSRVLHASNLVDNHRQWSQEVLQLLDCFFVDARSQPYRDLEAGARCHALLRVDKLTRQMGRRDALFRMQMLVQAFGYSPKQTLRYLAQTWLEASKSWLRPLWKQLSR